MTAEELDEIKLKAQAFDNLMAMFHGKEEFVRSYYRAEPTQMSASDVVGNLPSKAQTAKMVRIDIYEWKLRLANSTDLRQVLLDAAAKGLRDDTRRN